MLSSYGVIAAALVLGTSGEIRVGASPITTTSVIKSMERKPALTIKEVKLGRSKAWGQTDCKKLIEIDPRMKSKKYLRILVHELLHVCFPTMGEREVRRVSRIIRDGLWKQHYRRMKP